MPLAPPLRLLNALNSEDMGFEGAFFPCDDSIWQRISSNVSNTIVAREKRTFKPLSSLFSAFSSLKAFHSFKGPPATIFSWPVTEIPSREVATKDHSSSNPSKGNPPRPKKKWALAKWTLRASQGLSLALRKSLLVEVFFFFFFEGAYPCHQNDYMQLFCFWGINFLKITITITSLNH